MSQAQALLGWLADTSDRLSPMVVKEVRQLVRGHEFLYSFSASLLAGLAIAFFGAADALTGSGTSGSWTFAALMSCLGLLGLAVVPLGAFSALRNERMDQTLELITLTALSPRRVVIGKLLVQAVKLATLFAAVAPFMAMSFLLGGIDFGTILMALVILFMASLWVSAACLFLSCLLRSRSMSVLVFGAAAILLLLVFGMGRVLIFLATGGGFGGGVTVYGSAGAPSWRMLAIMATSCLISMANLVLLAENRLSLPAENRVTPLRIGFLLQFLLIVGWTLSFIRDAGPLRSSAASALGVIGGLHLAMVATFTVTEGLIPPRRAVRYAAASASARWLRALWRPGGGTGVIYVLTQMIVLMLAARLLDPKATSLRWFAAMCGYICFFTGVPTFIFRRLRPAEEGSLRVRLAVLVLLPFALLAPDIIHYMVWRPEVVNLSYAGRHLVNPFRTLANWLAVETRGWYAIPLVMGVTGLLAYVGLIVAGAQTAAAESDRGGADPAADLPDRVDTPD